MRHVAAFVLPRHAGIISPASTTYHPEGAAVRPGLDIRDRKHGGKIATKLTSARGLLMSLPHVASMFVVFVFYGFANQMYSPFLRTQYIDPKK